MGKKEQEAEDMKMKEIEKDLGYGLDGNFRNLRQIWVGRKRNKHCVNIRVEAIPVAYLSFTQDTCSTFVRCKVDGYQQQCNCTNIVYDMLEDYPRNGFAQFGSGGSKNWVVGNNGTKDNENQMIVFKYTNKYEEVFYLSNSNRRVWMLKKFRQTTMTSLEKKKTELEVLLVTYNQEKKRLENQKNTSNIFLNSVTAEITDTHKHILKIDAELEKISYMSIPAVVVDIAYWNEIHKKCTHEVTLVEDGSQIYFGPRDYEGELSKF